MRFEGVSLTVLEEPTENGTVFRLSARPVGAPFRVAVDLTRDKVVRGISFELPRTAPADEPISLRDVRRVPLQRIVEAARLVKPDENPALGDAVAVLVPRGRPSRRGDEFYRAIATAYREFTRRGQSPAKEIARRKRVDENLVHQWFHRARNLGFLEPPPPRKKAKRRG